MNPTVYLHIPVLVSMYMAGASQGTVASLTFKNTAKTRQCLQLMCSRDEKCLPPALCLSAPVTFGALLPPSELIVVLI